ncbi:serine/threonine-protein kinase [Actinomadura vinacea]
MRSSIVRNGMELGGRYRLETLIGRGGMGEVWCGTDRRLRRPVAVKVLSLDAAPGEQAVARLRREAETAGTLQHPAVTVVFDIGEEPHPEVPDGRLVYLVMELLEGRDLRTVLGVAPGGLPVPQAVSLAAQVAEGLAAAHARGVVHRDVKPANLLILADGRVKICDFGIAWLGDTTTRLTTDGSVIGTPRYMAPEQFGGEVGPRTDLYSLGCVLHELLTGRPPFKAEGGFAQLMYMHLNATPEPLPDSFPAELRALVAELLAKDMAARPADAATVAQRLRAVGGGTTERPPLPPTAPQPSVLPPSGDPTRGDAGGTRSGAKRLKAGIAAVAAVLVAAGAGIAFAVSAASDSDSRDKDLSPSKPSASAAASRDPLTPMNDGWRVVTSQQWEVAYEVPASWTPGTPGYVMSYTDATEKPVIGASNIAYIQQENGDGNGCYLALAGVRSGKGIVNAAPGQMNALAESAEKQARQWAVSAFHVDYRPPVLDAGTRRTLTLAGGVQAQVHSFTVQSVAGVDECNATRSGARVHVLTAASRVPGRDGGPFTFTVLTGPNMRFADQRTVDRILRSVRSLK